MYSKSNAARRFALRSITVSLATAGLLYAPSALAADCAAAWAEGNTYTANSLASYQSTNYKALVTHTAYVGTNWNPAASPTLWSNQGD